MKLSKRRLRGILIAYSMMLFVIGLIILVKTVPENIWMAKVLSTATFRPILLIFGLVGITVSGYMLGTPLFRDDDPKIEINLKRLFRRELDTVGELIGQLKAAEKTVQERAGKLFAARNRYGEYGYIGYARETVERQLKSDPDKSWLIEETMMIPLKEWDEIRHEYQERFGDEQAGRPGK